MKYKVSDLKVGMHVEVRRIDRPMTIRVQIKLIKLDSITFGYFNSMSKTIGYLIAFIKDDILIDDTEKEIEVTKIVNNVK